MSQIITRNAHARNHANSELPKPTPRNGRAASHNRGRGSAPIPLSAQRHPPPSDVFNAPERDGSPVPPPLDRPASPTPLDIREHGNAEGPGEPDDEPEPSDDGPNNDGGDEGDERRAGEPEDNDPFGGPENITARDLLRILGPLLAERRGLPITPPVAPLHSRRLKVNPPEEFDGSSPKKLKSFLVGCNNAFRADPDTFLLHDKRVSYALSYLRGSAQRHFDTQLEDEEEDGFIPPDWLHDWTRFVEELRDMFGDPNAEATAEAELDSLRMRGNQKFADFLVDFNTLSSQVNWGDRALRHRLKQALPDRIKDQLALVEDPIAFNDWKRLVQNIDQRYWERQAEIRRDNRSNNGNNATRGQSSTNARNATPAPTAAPTNNPARETSNTVPVTRHLTAQGGLTQTERERRIAQGLCLYCGGQGHKAGECSKARKAREKTGRAAQTTETTPSPPAPSTTLVEPKITVVSEN